MLLGPRLVTLCCPPPMFLNLFNDHYWPWSQSMKANFAMVTAANGLVLIDSQIVFRFPGNLFPESKHQSSAKCYLKAFWRQHFVPAWLWCIALFYFPLILNNYFLQEPRCALTWGQNICEKFPFFYKSPIWQVIICIFNICFEENMFYWKARGKHSLNST